MSGSDMRVAKRGEGGPGGRTAGDEGRWLAKYYNVHGTHTRKQHLQVHPSLLTLVRKGGGGYIRPNKHELIKPCWLGTVLFRQVQLMVYVRSSQGQKNIFSLIL